MRFAVISQQELVSFWLLLFLVFLFLFTVFFFRLWQNREISCLSPYTGFPLRKGTDIFWVTRQKILRYLYDMHDYHNRIFDLQRAAFCRETGRIFPDALTWYGTIKVDWSFLQNRHPGDYVSWGSLTDEQKVLIAEKHGTLKGYQTEISSPTPSPQKVQPRYAHTKPGPLYVDLRTATLIGWKCVPDTDLEVLIVQKPQKQYLPRLKNDKKNSDHFSSSLR